jgi:hypothetical protein
MGSNGVSGTALYGNYGGDGWAQFIRGDLTTGLIDGGQVNSNPAAGDANSLRNTYQGLADYVTCPGGFFNYDSSQAIGSRWSCSGLQPNAVSTTPYTVQTTDKFNILADTNSVASTWNLPAPSGSFASIWGFGVDVSLAGAPLTISATGGGCGSCQINGVNTLILGLGDTAFIYASDTTHWKALVSYSSSGVTVAQ